LFLPFAILSLKILTNMEKKHIQGGLWPRPIGSPNFGAPSLISKHELT